MGRGMALVKPSMPELPQAISELPQPMSELPQAIPPQQFNDPIRNNLPEHLRVG